MKDFEVIVVNWMLQDTLVISFWFVFASDYENRKFYFCAMHFISLIIGSFYLEICQRHYLERKKRGKGVGLLWLKARKLLSFVYMKCIAQLKQAQWNYSIFDVVKHDSYLYLCVFQIVLEHLSFCLHYFFLFSSLTKSIFLES